jgi:hypothetical protein
MDGWKMDEGMDGVLKNIKIGYYILYAKNNTLLQNVGVVH